jgi:hypothetical protein
MAFGKIRVDRERFSDQDHSWIQGFTIPEIVVSESTKRPDELDFRYQKEARKTASGPAGKRLAGSGPPPPPAPKPTVG